MDSVFLSEWVARLAAARLPFRNKANQSLLETDPTGERSLVCGAAGQRMKLSVGRSEGTTYTSLLCCFVRNASMRGRQIEEYRQRKSGSVSNGLPDYPLWATFDATLKLLALECYFLHFGLTILTIRNRGGSFVGCNRYSVYKARDLATLWCKVAHQRRLVQCLGCQFC